MPVHWALVSFWAWGHLRPESNLAVNLASKFPDLIISFLVDAEVAQKCKDEMARYAFLGGDERVLSRIRVIAVGRVPAGMTPEIEKRFAMMDPRRVPKSRRIAEARIHQAIDAMMRMESFKDDTGTLWKPVAAKPNLVICDILVGYVASELKQRYSLPVYIYFVGSATCFTRLYAPTALGGRCAGYTEECRAIEADAYRAEGRTFSQIAQHVGKYFLQTDDRSAIDQVWAWSSKFKDDVIRVKGLPPMYQWEDLPQSAWFPSVYELASYGLQLVECSDGVIFPTVLNIVSI
ncbi:glycosyltransferase family 1 protein [Calocera cornea HHB12733]|uniref:Glycosyltransferase family 1 protein n=1 Tax=Calocera cornea HHB12733 TaxID=1353952 RepID=A0A165FFB7_9BASI|nr:glycosyltransferase family 1 protein [Calocera cornea HHB12733]